MWSLAIRRKRLNHWSKGSFSDRLECHGSGWIPDLTRCDANQGFRIWFAVSVSRDSNASGLADCSRPNASAVSDQSLERSPRDLSTRCPTGLLPNRPSSALGYEAKEKEPRTAAYRVAFGSADRQDGLSLGHGRRRSGPPRSPLVPQLRRSTSRVRRAPI